DSLSQEASQYKALLKTVRAQSPRTEKSVSTLATLYLDDRAHDWLNSPKTSKCVSCHTMLPYSVVRPHEGNSSFSSLVELRSKIRERVQQGSAVEPWYSSDPQGSLSTEAVTNAAALVLSAPDIEGSSPGDPVTEEALDRMLKQQLPSGGFRWLKFDLAPFE